MPCVLYSHLDWRFNPLFSFFFTRQNTSINLCVKVNEGLFGILIKPGNTHLNSSHLVFDDITISDQQENFDVGQPGKSAPNLDELDMVSTARTVSEPLSKAIKSREYQAIMAALQNSPGTAEDK